MLSWPTINKIKGFIPFERGNTIFSSVRIETLFNTCVHLSFVPRGYFVFSRKFQMALLRIPCGYFVFSRRVKRQAPNDKSCINSPGYEQGKHTQGKCSEMSDGAKQDFAMREMKSKAYKACLTE